MRYLTRLVFVCLVLAGASVALAACGGDSGPEDREFDLGIADGKLNLDPAVIKVKQGDNVTLRIDADEDGAFHLHGYDIETEVGPEGSTTMEFTANATGNFRIAFHAGSHEHEGEDQCQAELPPGAPAPELRVAASAGNEPGEVNVAVELENFLLGPEATAQETVGGHWHLYIDGELQGMYQVPETTVFVSSGGEHQLMANLTDPRHCAYDVSAMTKVTVEEGAAGGMEGEEMEMEMEEDEEEITLGSLEVHPR